MSVNGNLNGSLSRFAGLIDELALLANRSGGPGGGGHGATANANRTTQGGLQAPGDGVQTWRTVTATATATAGGIAANAPGQTAAANCPPTGLDRAVDALTN